MKKVFERYADVDEFDNVIEQFKGNLTFPSGDDMSADEFVANMKAVRGLPQAAANLAREMKLDGGDTATLASVGEFPPRRLVRPQPAEQVQREGQDVLQEVTSCRCCRLPRPAKQEHACPIHHPAAFPAPTSAKAGSERFGPGGGEARYAAARDAITVDDNATRLIKVGVLASSPWRDSPSCCCRWPSGWSAGGGTSGKVAPALAKPSRSPGAPCR